jgi:hypothetical protein
MEKLYAQLALDAYQDNIPASMKIENRFTSTVAFIQFTPECNYVVFRGTNSFADWVFNLTAVPCVLQRKMESCGILSSA